MKATDTSITFADTIDWHVKADGRWLVETQDADRTAPVNVYVTPDRMAPVEYRYRASECMGWCIQECGHTLACGCDCNTIATEAADQDDAPVCWCGATSGDDEPCDHN